MVMDLSRDLTNYILSERVETTTRRWPYGSDIGPLLLAFGAGVTVRIRVAHESNEFTMPKENVETLLMFGVYPRVAVEADLTCKPTSGDASLFGTACALALYGSPASKREGRKVLEALQRPPKSWHPFLLDNSKAFPAGWANPTTPEEFGLEPIDPISSGVSTEPEDRWRGEEWLLGLPHLSWLSPDYASNSIRRLLGRNALYCLEELSTLHDGKWRKDIERIAEKHLRNERHDRLLPDYEDLRKAFTSCSKRFACQYLSEIKGVRAALGVLRSDLPDQYFIRGVKTLSVTPTALSCLGGHLARPLRMGDLVGMSGKNLAQLLWKLPWESVEPLALEHREKVLPKLTKATADLDNLSMLRECLTKHKKRIDARYLLPCSPAAEWKEEMRKLVGQCDFVRALKMKAQHEGLTEDHLYLLCVTEKDAHLRNVCAQMPIWAKAEQMRESVNIALSCPDPD
jgi:hypothetical protein